MPGRRRCGDVWLLQMREGCGLCGGGFSSRPSRMRTIVAGICRNIEPQISVLAQFFQELIGRRPTVEIFLYENNSTDGTKDALVRLQTLYPANLRVKMEDISREDLLAACKARTWDNLPCRLECIARARNCLLEFLQEGQRIADEDVVAFVDVDMAGLPPMERFVRYLTDFPADVDAVLANGLNRRGNYYDLYALRDPGQPFGPEIQGESFWKHMGVRRFTEKKLVFSGFGGIGIYRGACLRDNAYSGIPTPALDAFLKMQFRAAKQNPPVLETHINGALQGVYLFGAAKGTDIFYQNNSGYNFPVVCEHSTFHATMVMRGQGRIFVDPALIYLSTH